MSVLSAPAQADESQAHREPTRRSTGGNRVRRRTLTTAAFRRAVFAGLRKLQGGQITVVDRNQRNDFGQPSSDLSVTITVHDPRFYRAVALGASMGAAESYRDGYWSCDDLVGLIRIFSRDTQASEEMGGLCNWILDLGRKAVHRLNRNTRSGSRRNIAAHYDLSNDFYSLMLDDTMTYSCGVFPERGSSMREASVEKYDRICRKLRLSAGDQVLEIGTGWGGFAAHAAEHYGCHVTTTTISKQQYEHARQLLACRGIDHRVKLLLADYRDLTGQFDKLVSIEMIEAVGHEYFDTFFAKCSNLLRPHGLFALQAITIPDQRYDRYRKGVDFIQRYIFPGGCLPSLGAMTASMGRVTDLQLAHMEDFAVHYARTLACWRRRFHENAQPIRQLGMTDSFCRLWDYYLCYCEGAFREKQIGVSQFLFQKPQNRLAPRFPSLG